MVAAMASVKLVSGQSNLHTRYPHHHHHLLRTTDPPQQIMTLDDILPGRSTSTDYDPGSDSARDMSSPPSPAGSESRDHHGLQETPTKKNKRKLSEPKKRADFTTKSSRHSSPSALRESASHVSGHTKKMTNGHSKRSTSCKSARKSNINGIKRDTSSSSPSSLSNNDSDPIKDTSLVSLTNIIPPPFLSPMFAGVPSSPFGYVPSIYLAGRTFPRQGIHASFPSIPLNLQNGYIASSAVAGPHSSSTSLSVPAATSSMYSLSVARLTGSTSETAASDVPQSEPGTHTAVQSPLSSAHPAPSPYSVLHLQPSCLHRPGSSRTITASNDDDDDDEASSSRAPSPEDLSIGGKMSRKHRKNYKNMTRERRVEANARERTRVHTISAAFDALRRAVPSYSHNQKLSKLAILRIASSYILALARLNDQDYTSASDHIGKPLTFTECVDICTSTIQTEGRARRRH